MTSPIPFDYNIFYNYYKDTNNLKIDPTPRTSKYFENYKIKYDNKNEKYIEIKGKRVYVKVKPNNKILFSILEESDEPNIYWDDHYHFGIVRDFGYTPRNSTIKQPKIIADAVYFHKTIQDPHNKTRKNCYFLLNQDIRNIQYYDCLESVDGKMGIRFPIETEDYEFIKEIIQRPFIGKKLGGKKRKTVCKKIKRNKTIRKNIKI
jgi:hypothetical protein